MDTSSIMDLLEREPLFTIIFILCVVSLVILVIICKCWCRVPDGDINTSINHGKRYAGNIKKHSKEEEGMVRSSLRVEASCEEIPLNLSQPLPDKVNLFIVNEVFGPKKLYQQAKTDNGQFAVLFLGDKNGVEHKLKLGSDSKSTKFTDPSQVSYPDDKSLGNYIVARRDAKDEHAEKFLLDRFEALRNTYRGNNWCQPSFILIYSWCMPCGACAGAIIRLKKRMSKEIEVTVVYRTDYDPQQDSRNQKKLHDEGINLYKDKNYHERQS